MSQLEVSFGMGAAWRDAQAVWVGIKQSTETRGDVRWQKWKPTRQSTGKPVADWKHRPVNSRSSDRPPIAK